MNKKAEKIIVTIDPALEPIVPRFLELRRDDIKHINEALGSGDYETILRIGHSMKGSGAGYGFDYISDIGIKIENAGKEGDAGTIRKWTKELSAYIKKVEVVYDEQT